MCGCRTLRFIINHFRACVTVQVLCKKTHNNFSNKISCCFLPFPHDVAVEGVENTLVSQLKRFIQDLHVFAAFDFRSVSALLSC